LEEQSNTANGHDDSLENTSTIGVKRYCLQITCPWSH